MHSMYIQKHSAGKLLSSLCDRSRWNPSAQNTTHIKLGSDSSPRTSVVQSDFTEKPTSRVRLPSFVSGHTYIYIAAVTSHSV